MTVAQGAPIPAGRSIVSCKKLLWRLKEKHRDDIAKIKAGEALGSTLVPGEDDANATTDKKAKPGRKRKTKADQDTATDASPTKKATGRKKKDTSPTIKQEVTDEPEDESLENEI